MSSASPRDDLIAVIVCGGRNWTDRELVYDKLDRYLLAATKTLVLIVGRCRGPDQIAEAWAQRRHVDVVPMPAEWRVHADGWCSGAWCQTKDYCKAAGFRRNQMMADKALELATEQFVFAFKDRFGKGPSSGTEDMVERASAVGMHGLKVSHPRHPDPL